MEDIVCQYENSHFEPIQPKIHYELRRNNLDPLLESH